MRHASRGKSAATGVIMCMREIGSGFAGLLLLLPPQIVVLQQHTAPLGLVFLVAGRHRSTS
jgi:hypothetical protein